MGRDFRYLVYNPSEDEVVENFDVHDFKYDDFEEPDFWISRHSSHISEGVYSYVELLEKIKEYTKNLMKLANWKKAQKLMSDLQETPGEEGDDKEKRCFDALDELGVEYCPNTYFCHPPEFAKYWVDDSRQVSENEREIAEAIFVYGFVLKEMSEGSLAVISYG